MALTKLPAVVKQKFDAKAQMRLIRILQWSPISLAPGQVRGTMQLAYGSSLSLEGGDIQVTHVNHDYFTIELPANRLIDLANDPAVAYFELASEMSND